MTVPSKATLRQTLAIATVAFNVFHTGIGDGWSAPTLYKQQQPGSLLQLSTDDSSWIVSATHAGFLLGCLANALMLDTVGRKISAIICALTYFTVWLGILLTTSVRVICWLRFVLGIAHGITLGVDTVYVAEVASPSLRGVFSSGILSLYFIGVLIEYVIASYLSYQNTAIVNTALSFLSTISAFWMIESPHFLLLKRKDNLAEKSFLMLKGGVTDLAPYAQEFHRLKQNVLFERSKRNSLKEMVTSSENYKSILILVLLSSLSDATGYYPILSYTSTIFHSTDTFSSNELTILLGFSQFVSSPFSLLLISRFNRRTLLLAIYSACTLNHVFIAALFYLNQRSWQIPHFSWLIFVTVNLYIAIIALSYPTIFSIRGELLPLSVKAFGGCAIILGKSATNFTLTMIFLRVNEYYGMYANFVIYFVICGVYVAFIYFFVPETRDKTLTEIQDDLKKLKFIPIEMAD